MSDTGGRAVSTAALVTLRNFLPPRLLRELGVGGSSPVQLHC